MAPTRAAHARALAETRSGLTVLEGDFYTAEFSGPFGVVCYWDGFGIGNDEDQRRLLWRIATDWLSSDGSALIEVFSPLGPARDAGIEELHRETIDLIRRFHFDAAGCRYVDEWQPVGRPEEAMRQSLRCYSPAELMLLLEDKGLQVARLEVEGEQFDRDEESVRGRLMEAYTYLAQLVPDVAAQ